jgi:uncharacterized protein (TIGR00725 family)
MMTTIGIIGRGIQHANDLIDPKTMEFARQIGRLVAKRGGVVVSGGLGGVMEAASQGAKEEGGLTIGFLPSMDKATGNPFLDVVLPTGLGRMRNLLTARGCDAIIMIGGGCGTLNELTISYAEARPVIVLRGSGGWADKIEAVLDDGHYLDDRKTVSIDFADTPDEVVERAFARAGNSSDSAQPD